MTLCLGVGIFLFLSFHEVTSLHSPSFHRNDFSTCSTHFSFGVKPQQSLRRAVPHTHAHADVKRPGARARVHVCVCLHAYVNGVVQCLPVKNPTIYRRNLRREKNDRLVSVHTSIDYGDVWSKKSAPRLVLVRR